MPLELVLPVFFALRRFHEKRTCKGTNLFLVMHIVGHYTCTLQLHGIFA